jgi:hypothetical protein
MIPELRAQIERCSGDRESLRRVQALLPADDGEFSIIGARIPLWFLIARRRAFLEGCMAPKVEG